MLRDYGKNIGNGLQEGGAHRNDGIAVAMRPNLVPSVVFWRLRPLACCPNLLKGTAKKSETLGNSGALERKRI